MRFQYLSVKKNTIFHSWAVLSGPNKTTNVKGTSYTHRQNSKKKKLMIKVICLQQKFKKHCESWLLRQKISASFGLTPGLTVLPSIAEMTISLTGVVFSLRKKLKGKKCWRYNLWKDFSPYTIHGSNSFLSEQGDWNARLGTLYELHSEMNDLSRRCVIVINLHVFISSPVRGETRQKRFTFRI